MVDQTMMTKEDSQSTHNRESFHTIVNTVLINFSLLAFQHQHHDQLQLGCRLDGHHRQPSLTSELKLPPESDNESIADYADGMGDG